MGYFKDKFMEDINNKVKRLVNELDAKYGLDGTQTVEEMEIKVRSLLLSNLKEFQKEIE